MYVVGAVIMIKSNIFGVAIFFTRFKLNVKIDTAEVDYSSLQDCAVLNSE